MRPGRLAAPREARLSSGGEATRPVVWGLGVYGSHTAGNSLLVQGEVPSCAPRIPRRSCGRQATRTRNVGQGTNSVVRIRSVPLVTGASESSPADGRADVVFAAVPRGQSEVQCEAATAWYTRAMSTITNKAVVREFRSWLSPVTSIGSARYASSTTRVPRAGPRGSRGPVNSRAGSADLPPGWLSSCRVAENDLVGNSASGNTNGLANRFEASILRRPLHPRGHVRLWSRRRAIVERWAIRDDLAMIVQLGNATPNSSR